jgi:alkanesulfonate monooxygenase SsuD/methylene tetrahydromethanopterin reductase-like flavin-dependent oxidoreductase (luciferase family)
MKFSVSLHMERFSPKQDITQIKNETLELVQLADRGGFCTVWTPEHHTIEFTIAPSPFQICTWWAQHTEQIRVGVATIVAPYWTPLRLAGEAALCDHLTNGRLELGIARGAYQYEFDRMADGLPQQEGGRYLREIVPAIRNYWAGDYEHKGEIWQVPKATSVPKPLQQPHPPIWIAARDPNTYDFAFKVGANIMATPLSRPTAEVTILGNKFREAHAANPTVPRPKFMMLRRACLFERSEDWEEPVRLSIEYGRAFENLFQNIGEVNNGFPEAVSYDKVDGANNYDTDAIRDALLFGTPDEVIEKLSVYEEAGVDEVALGITFNTPFEMQRKTLELFSREVIPVFEQRAKDRAREAEKAAKAQALAS